MHSPLPEIIFEKPNLNRQIADAKKNAALVKATKGGGTFLDLGANIGEVAIQCAPLFHRVVAVEANERAAQVMARRVAEAQLGDKIKIIVGAVAASDGETFFVSSPSFASLGATARREKRLKRDGYYLSAPSISFRGLVSDYRPTTIKMDIEGCEFECLEGFRFPPFVRSLIVEFHGREADTRRLTRSLSAQGFSARLIESPGWSLRTGIFAR